MWPALILFSHGSLLCGSRSLINRHVDRLKKDSDFSLVTAGYLNYTEPAIEQAIQDCVNAGAAIIVIVPYFLVAGKFVTEDLPARLKTATALFPNVTFQIARALEDERFIYNAIDQVLLSAVDPLVWQKESLEKSRAQCELRPDCPLFQTIMCKAALNL